ncbi:MAG: STAS domain-containing protein [Planctomycetes bacterium]|nr:STAS domain-containing protein [Planctomycetota bacterium]
MTIDDSGGHFFKVRRDGDVAVVDFTMPRLTEDENMEQFGQELYALVSQHDIRKIAANMAQVEYATSSALGKLITLHRRLHRENGTLVLCGVSGTLADILNSARLIDYFNVTEDLDSAIARLQADGAP